MRVASIDIGTNSVLLLIAEGKPGAPASATALAERCTITRLGKGVDKTRRLAPDAVARTLACLQDYASLMASHDVQACSAVATSAARDAEGAEEFVQRAAQILGTVPRVIDGPTEARMTFHGALSGLPVRGEVAVFDIGGGSTEVVTGAWDGERGEVHQAVSLDVGAVRLTERHARSEPPVGTEIAAMREHVRVELQRIGVPFAGATWVGIAGTVTTLCAMGIEMVVYDGARVHGAWLTRSEVDGLQNRMLSLGLEERRKMPGLEPARADVIVAGSVIAQEVMGWAGANRVMVSDRGVRWGLALELLGSR